MSSVVDRVWVIREGSTTAGWLILVILVDGTSLMLGPDGKSWRDGFNGKRFVDESAWEPVI